MAKTDSVQDNQANIEKEHEEIQVFVTSIRDALELMELYPRDFTGLFGAVRDKLIPAKQALKIITDQYAANYPQDFLLLLKNINNEIEAAEKILDEIESKARSRVAERNEARKKFDKITKDLLFDLKQLDNIATDIFETHLKGVKVKRLELKQDQESNDVFLWIAVVLYFGITIFLAWWTYRSLAQPIQTLDKATSSSLDAGKPFILAETGPEEIRSLTSRLRVLVHGLEERVAHRTQALHAKTHQLEQEMLQRKQLETQLVHAQKMEAVGQLASGIAHEINSPSQFVNDNVMFLKDAVNELLAAVSGQGEIPDEKELDFLRENAPESVNQALEGIERITTIVQSMKNFAYRDAASEKKPQNLNQGIRATSVVATNEWKYHAELELDLDLNLSLVSCNIGEINQVVLNLIVNAAHAIRDSKPEGEKGLIVVSTKQYDQFVVITIADNGGGIPEHVQGKIFEPFFTTKDVGVGTGQGLAIAHNVITKSHGGHIWFETEQGKGTTFFIRLSLENPPQPVES